MLPRKNLIPLKKEFPRIRQEGKLYNSASFGLVISYSRNSPIAQAAFIVSKKVSNKSVVRHEVKRLLSDAVARDLPRLSKNIQLLFLAKPSVVGKSLEELAVELELVLKRAKIL